MSLKQVSLDVKHCNHGLRLVSIKLAIHNGSAIKGDGSRRKRKQYVSHAMSAYMHAMLFCIKSRK